MTSEQIRSQFIDFFVQKHGHTFVPSSSVVPLDDPTLLFTNAGMNQFKPIFLGTEKRPYTRAANTQKCIRAGGKHNDLDDVGRSRRHETFFEMLGNWSFGDYFKRGAIEMAWELLTKVWKLDPERLHVTCYQGDEKAGVPRDTEAAGIWKDVARLPDDHIHYLGKENFWEMGDTGPCGPCTEIFIDRTPGKTGGPSVVKDDDPRVMEFWNLVFIQYNRNPDRSLTVLPSQHVDTGMGLERICQVLQDKSDVYAIDLWEPFWEKLKELTGHAYGGKFPRTNTVDAAAEAADAELRKDIAFRVIADHARCLTFALMDGAVPSNEGRGYVLRRILRRAVRFGRQQLGLQEAFLHTLVPIVVDSMGEPFPELRNHPDRVAAMIKDEEVGFGRTLERGIALFNEAAIAAGINTVMELAGGKSMEGIDNNPLRDATETELFVLERHFRKPEKSPREVFRAPGVAGWSWVTFAGPKPPRISARDAFKLHDTYGFPIDLTRIMAEERGMTVDAAGFETLMEQAREMARAGGKEGESRLFELPPDVLAELRKRGVQPTDDSAKYNAMPIGATVKAIWYGSKLIDQTHGAEAAGQHVAVILDRTCFYAEMGGQVGDTGELRGPGDAVMAVSTTRAAGGYVLHVGNMEDGHFRVGDHVTATLAGVRPRTEKNHTATHLANWALREVLGDDVHQRGSLVDPEKLRFDFSHGKPLSEEEVARVETLVDDCIRKDLPVYAEEAPQEQALKINGLRAVFGEKYPPMVRVVSIGVPVGKLLTEPDDPIWRQYSIEFCGGTHLKKTGQVGSFVITGEELVSKGVRRVFALTGEASSDVLARGKAAESFAAQAKSKPESELGGIIAELQRAIAAGDLPLHSRRRVQATVAELQDRYKKWEKANRAQAASNVDVAEVSARLLSEAPALGPGKLVIGEVAGATLDQLLSVTDSLKKKACSYAVLLGSVSDGKVSFVAAVSDDLIAKGLKAGDWIRQTAKAAGGGGGGRPQMAQAGGKDPAKLPEALTVATEFAKRAVG
ncbi:MAG TPA: alanine--tRNA ligase [Tepidisphaeraceae bacterium]|nr:alanine--tRNA ligase [Tepidisphaeraceae bacterium]